MQPLMAGARSFTDAETYLKQIPDWCAPLGVSRRGDLEGG